MSRRRLPDTMVRIEPTGRPAATPPVLGADHEADALRYEWRVAAASARAAYEWWRAHPATCWYSVYRAYADRADAAQDALARAAGARA